MHPCEIIGEVNASTNNWLKTNKALLQRFYVLLYYSFPNPSTRGAGFLGTIFVLVGSSGLEASVDICLVYLGGNKEI